MMVAAAPNPPNQTIHGQASCIHWGRVSSIVVWSHPVTHPCEPYQRQPCEEAYSSDRSRVISPIPLIVRREAQRIIGSVPTPVRGSSFGGSVEVVVDDGAEVVVEDSTVVVTAGGVEVEDVGGVDVVVLEGGTLVVAGVVVTVVEDDVVETVEVVVVGSVVDDGGSVVGGLGVSHSPT